MRHFNEILTIAEERHSGLAAVEARIPPVKTRRELAGITGDRWLSDITKNVFRAGFSRKVINDRWDGFEAAFKGFDLHKCASMGDDWLDELLKDTRIVRNGARIQSVQRNAVFILEEMENHGSFGVFLSGQGVCVILCPDAFSYAMGKRSSNMMASWLLTRCHSRTDRFHSAEVALSAK